MSESEGVTRYAAFSLFSFVLANYWSSKYVLQTAGFDGRQSNYANSPHFIELISFVASPVPEHKPNEALLPELHRLLQVHHR